MNDNVLEFYLNIGYVHQIITNSYAINKVWFGYSVGGDGLMDKLCSEALEAVNKAF